MRIGNFTALVPEGREHGGGHVGLAHGTVYTIRMTNHAPAACDALVEVDGKEIGLFRLDGHGRMTLECPGSKDSGRFTFFKAGTPESDAAGGGSVSRNDRGLVRVTFKPEKPRLSPPYKHYSEVRPRGVWGQSQDYGTVSTRSVNASAALESSFMSFSPDFHPVTRGSEEKTCGGIVLPDTAAPGVTGLTGTSDQKFVQVRPIDYDAEDTFVAVTLRLVCVDKADAVRPIPESPRGNKTPAPVG